MQQQLVPQIQQHRPIAASNSATITTDHIQQYLDENKALILNILENQNTGKFSECAENQTRLQHNLMYLAAIADCQPKPYMNTMVPNPQIMAQSHTGLAQQMPFTMTQQQHALQSQLGIGSLGQTPQSRSTMEGQTSGGFPDFSFAEGSHGLGRLGSHSNKENRGNTSTEDIQDFPQKKGKLTTSAT